MIINLTPHAVVVGERVFPPSGKVARISVSLATVREAEGIPLKRATYGKVVDLPAEQPGTLFIVSSMVRVAEKREDLISPAELVRDEKGNVIGCQSFETNC